MNILFVTHLLNGLLMIAMPVGLAIFLTRKFHLEWWLWWIGVTTFVLSQVGHIPFNYGVGLLLNRTGMVYWSPTAQLLFNAVFLGLSAGLFEEGARFLILRFWAKDARSWRTGVLFGAGHGGAEAIILGAVTLYGFIQLTTVRNVDLSKLVPASQLALAQQQVHAYWSMTWYNSLLGALERFFTIPCQIAMAVMVMQVFTRKRIRWLFLAIGYHALLDASAVLNIRYLGVYWTEAVVCGFAILSVFLIFALRQPEPQTVPIPVISTPDPVFQPMPVEESNTNLDETRFQ
jgi:uncharacterized membrane protein YhfC